MRTQSGFLRRHSLIIGLALMFLFTWPQDLANSGVIPIKLPFLVYLFLGWGFVVAALLMTWLTLGRPVVGELLRRYLKGHVGWKWYLALLIVPAVQALGLLLYSLFTRTPINLGHVLADDLRPPSVSRLAFVLPFFILDAIANGEEIGWRGYVLPRLQARHNALVAALVLGLIWALWHVPKLLTHWDWPYFAVFALDTVAKSLLLAWLYNNTGGSLLLVVLAHAAWNTLSIFLPVASTLSSENLGAYASQAVLEVLVAVLIVALAGAENLSRSRTRQHQT